MEQILTELLQRVTRIEAKIDGYNALKDKVNSHDTAIAELKKDTSQTHRDVSEWRALVKWVSFTVGGLIIAAIAKLVLR